MSENRRGGSGGGGTAVNALAPCADELGGNLMDINEGDLWTGGAHGRGGVTIFGTSSNTRSQTEGQWELRAVKKARRAGGKNKTMYSSTLGLTFASQEIAESAVSRNHFALKIFDAEFSQSAQRDQPKQVGNAAPVNVAAAELRAPRR